MPDASARPIDQNRVTLFGLTLLFSHRLIRPERFKGQPDSPLEYSTTLLIPANHAAMGQIATAMKAAIQLTWGVEESHWPKKLRGVHYDIVFHRCADEPKLGIDPDWHYVRVKSRTPIDIVGPDAKLIPPERLAKELFDGRQCNAIVAAYAYVYQGTPSTPERLGVSLWLHAMQLSKRGERLNRGRVKGEESFAPETIDGDPDPDDKGLPPLSSPGARR
jgi:hypothetical protein